VADATAEELGKIDVGSWFGSGKFAGQTVPKLVDVMDIASRMSGPIYVELKVNAQNYKRTTAAVCNTIRRSPLLERVILQGFHLGVANDVRCILPTAQTAALFEPKVRRMLFKEQKILQKAAKFRAQQLSVHSLLATKALGRLAAAAGMPLTVWTVDDPKWIDRSRQRGIGALITNDPARMLARRDETP
jgi:glycerophosphoryl diester phosphodiesterase